MTTTLPSCKKIKSNELAQLAPALHAFYLACLPDAEEEGEDENGEMEMLYFGGDTHLTEAQYDSLKKTYGFYTPLAVNGDLVIEDGFGSSALIGGDLLCDSFGYGEWLHVRGTVKARYYATFIAEDHEMLRPTSSIRIETPYLFAWFYDLQSVSLLPGTNVFIICDGSDFQRMNLRDPYFFWKEWAFVIRPELSYTIESDYSDAIHWNFTAIEAALKKGESLFIAGFTPACLPAYRQALQLVDQRQFEAAFKAAQAAAVLAPGFYYARYYMGYCLYRLSAFEQAIPMLDQAAKLFPEKHKNLENSAADYLALAFLRLGRVDEAMAWSSFSITSTQQNKDDGRQQWLPYRVRGEAHLLSGDPEAARTDLEKAVNLHFYASAAQWLLGLAYHQLGNGKEAGKHHALAVKLQAGLAVGYNEQNNTNFLQAPPTIVDWA